MFLHCAFESLNFYSRFLITDLNKFLITDLNKQIKVCLDCIFLFLEYAES